MFVEYILIIFFYCVSSSDCQHHKKTICEGSSCYYLYEADNSYLTWDQSLEFCTNNGMAMAKIESNQTQKVIERLLQDLPQSTQRQIWIGGRWSINDRWRYMNGTEFKKQVTTSSQTASYCLFVKICKDLTQKYHDDNCDEKKSPSRLLCQYDESKTGSCISPDSQFGDKCYRKTKYDGQEPNKINWYNSQTYCSQSDIQGDIAYSYLDDDTLINDIINFVDDSKDCIQLWFGVRKRIWFWMTGSNINGDKQPINYFNWHDNIEIDSPDDDCIYIDRDNGNKWFTQRCTGSPVIYFICMNVSTNTIVTGHRATTTTSDRNATVKWEENKFPLVYIAPIMIGLVILTVVPGLVAFFVLRNKRRVTKDESEYADIEPDQSFDDVISPHGIVSAGKIPVGEIKHKETSSGDLYAMSIKQVNKSNGNLDTKKKDRNPEELHTKAKKKRNRKPKPSGGENIQHFEAPSGELYAKVIK